MEEVEKEMSMSYCLFQNALYDLSRCRDVLYEKDILALSEDEQKAARKLIAVAMDIADDFGDLAED